MTKRPRLSEHMRIAERAGSDPGAASSRVAEGREIAPQAIQGPERPRILSAGPAPVPDRPMEGTLSDVFVEAYLAMAHASYLGWRQGMMMQFRLAASLMASRRSPYIPPALTG